MQFETVNYEKREGVIELSLNITHSLKEVNNAYSRTI